MGEPVVRRPSSETGTRNGVKQKTEADPSSIMAENSHLISKMPERETGLPNTYCPYLLWYLWTCGLYAISCEARGLSPG